jgi:Methylase involved in ubiquinone/menaquinone biosynthesis
MSALEYHRKKGIQMPRDNIEQGSRIGRSRLPADPWEQAYLRFESPEQEIRKFIGRLKFMDATKWPRDAKIVELFCGRGSGLVALHRLGFSQVKGIDLSPALAAEYAGPGKVLVGDCRQLPFENVSKDVLIVQGGLHHLPVLPEDVDQVLAEARRVLKNDGLLLVIEPWLTPFLSLVHGLCRSRIVRVLSPKIDTLATMTHYERKTYEQWLSQPGLILDSLHEGFRCERCHFKWGKIYFAGRKRVC